MTVTTGESRTRAAIRAWRLYRSVVMQWTNAGQQIAPARHGLRVARVTTLMPQLARALDALAETVVQAPYFAELRCPSCGYPVEAVTARVDPQTIAHRHQLQPCGCDVTREDAIEAWEAGAETHVTPINGATLAAAEQERARVEEGHTYEDDLTRYGDAELSWAAWCLLDAASRDAADTAEVPPMWPWPAATWKPEASRLRMLIKAAGLVQAEIDLELITAGDTDPATLGAPR